MMNFAVGSSSRRCATVLAAVAVSSLALSAALVAAPAQGSSALYGTTESTPNAIAIDSAGNIYTTNYNYGSGAGSVSKLIPGGASAGGSWPASTGAGSIPRGIAIDSADNIYVTLIGSDAVMKLMPNGTFADGNWPVSTGTGSQPLGIAIDSADNIFVALIGSDAVMKLLPNGTSPGGNWPASTGAGSQPVWIATDSAGNIFTGNNGGSGTVSKITPSGSAVGGNWPASTGAGAGAMTTDSAGNVYVTRWGVSSVAKLAPDGTNFGSPWPAGTGSYPSGITIDSAGNLYTANDAYNPNRVTRIAANGTAAGWADSGIEPIAATIDSGGNVYVANASSSNVWKATGASPAPPSRPAAPVAALSGGTSATVSAANPASARYGSPTSYSVTSLQDNTLSCTITAPNPSCIVSGLTLGTAYTFTAKANLNTWQTAASAASNSVTPAAVPAAPTSLIATPGDGSASIAFTLGADNGAAITNLDYSIDDGATWRTRLGPATSPLAITGLTNGTTYQVKLRAINSVGNGTPSSAVSVTPAAVPAAPTSLIATPGDGSASIAFTLGADNGAAITNLDYSIDDGATWRTRLGPATSPLAITGLTNGTTYPVKLRAINSVGNGTPSSAVSVTPAATPTPTPDPSNKFVTLPVDATNSALRSTLVVSDPGIATQMGTFIYSSGARSARRLTACAGSKKTTKAGRYKINCTLTAGARSARRRSSIRITLVTTFTPTGGTARSVTRTVTLKKTSSGVTG